MSIAAAMFLIAPMLHNLVGLGCVAFVLGLSPGTGGDSGGLDACTSGHLQVRCGVYGCGKCATIAG